MFVVRNVLIVFSIGICVATNSGCCSIVPSEARRNVGLSEAVLDVSICDVQGILNTPSDVPDPRGDELHSKLQRLRLAAEAALKTRTAIPIFVDPAVASIRFRLNTEDGELDMSFYVAASMSFRQALDWLCSISMTQWRISDGHILVEDKSPIPE